MFKTSLPILFLCAVTLVPASATAQRQKKAKLEQVSLCDSSACYVAWKVVDSDGDGVSDADELAAGTDPFNKLSKPSLIVVVKIKGEKRLPSFEAGRGVFVVFPAEIQEKIAAGRTDLLAAFPMAKARGDSLTRAGITSELLKKHGITSRMGFTIGLTHPTKTDPNLPPLVGPKVAGIRATLVSKEGDPTPLDPNVGNHGKVVKDEVVDGDRFITYDDGTTMAVWDLNGDVTVMDADGNIVFTSEYVNPDTDGGVTTPTAEQEAATLRVRGAAVRTVQNWAPITSDNKPPKDRHSTIMLVDPEYPIEAAIVLDVPRVTTAQPESRPDLPNPGVSATPPAKGPKP